LSAAKLPCIFLFVRIEMAQESCRKTAASAAIADSADSDTDGECAIGSDEEVAALPFNSMTFAELATFAGLKSRGPVFTEARSIVAQLGRPTVINLCGDDTKAQLTATFEGGALGEIVLEARGARWTHKIQENTFFADGAGSLLTIAWLSAFQLNIRRKDLPLGKSAVSAYTLNPTSRRYELIDPER
jgi:hypothetical protein